jgi:ABC-type nitrate/sulfonate/bicarbonate transport system permease component
MTPTDMSSTVIEPAAPASLGDVTRRGVRSRWPQPMMLRLGAIMLLVALWEAWARAAADPLFFSPPSAVLAALWDMFADRSLLAAFAATLWQLGLAFALAVLAGSLAGFLIGLNRISLRSLYPMILMAYAIPQTTILPLFILTFGAGAASKVAFGFTHGTFPIVISVIAGMQGIKPALVKCARSMGAGKVQILRLVVLPCVVPSLFTGMRLGMSATLLGILLAELYVTSAGIGRYAHIFTDTFQPAKLFALIGALAAMAVILNETMRRMEIRHGRWRA